MILVARILIRPDCRTLLHMIHTDTRNASPLACSFALSRVLSPSCGSRRSYRLVDVVIVLRSLMLAESDTFEKNVYLVLAPNIVLAKEFPSITCCTDAVGDIRR